MVRMLHSGDVHGVVQGDEVRLVVHVQDGCLDVADVFALCARKKAYVRIVSG